ncbi:hypothetical protein [Rhodoferax sediminis]|uniref:Uncharacterized protein n=1 Tax=Rhodoferax sediminis TaxID=2509614 RepID=A0A515D7G8_9BURK|nr:hypothetical protein [Rhodoferax sediminis]QDL36364.1 hypothetical protein EUB48_02895 [Rhodoferax sediminis]
MFSVLVATGCAGKPFQPIPPKLKQWDKEGVSIEGVKAALIECGYDNPFNGFQAQKKVAMNELIRADRCMEQKGFHYLLSDRKSICDDKFLSSFPACTDGAILDGSNPAWGSP